MELYIIHHGLSIGYWVTEDMPDRELTELKGAQAARVMECMRTV